MPDDYHTLLALAYQVDLFHGPASDTPDDPRLTEFLAGVCRIINRGTRPPTVTLLEADDSRRMTVMAVSERPEVEQLCRLWEMRDLHRQRVPWMPGSSAQAWDGPANATAAVDLYGDPVALYAPLGPRPTEGASPDYRACATGPDALAGTCQEFYDRRPRRSYRTPYLGIAWNHGPEAIADHIAPALAAYAADAT
jgi:hypothetical protein